MVIWCASPSTQTHRPLCNTYIGLWNGGVWDMTRKWWMWSHKGVAELSSLKWLDLWGPLNFESCTFSLKPNLFFFWKRTLSVRILCCCIYIYMYMYISKQKYLELKYLWGCHPNYLLSSVASMDTTTCQNNATTYRKYEYTQFHSGMGTDTDKLCIHFPFFESFLI